MTYATVIQSEDVINVLVADDLEALLNKTIQTLLHDWQMIIGEPMPKELFYFIGRTDIPIDERIANVEAIAGDLGLSVRIDVLVA